MPPKNTQYVPWNGPVPPPMPQVATSQIGFPKFVEAAFHEGVLGPSSKPPSMSCSTETQPPLEELELAADEDDELATEDEELLATDEDELLAADEDELAAEEEATDEELATEDDADDELVTDDEVVAEVVEEVVEAEVDVALDELVEPTVTWRPVEVETDESSPPAPPEPLRLLPFAHPNVARRPAKPRQR